MVSCVVPSGVLPITIATAHGDVSALVSRPSGAVAIISLAHGAGAGMQHPFLVALTEALAEQKVAVLRFQFPYMERGHKRPDRPHVLGATVRAAAALAQQQAPDLPLFAGGKSMGGRMTSLAAAEAPLPAVRGLCFVGFPLHPPRRPSTQRADHLQALDIPLLFLQGTRDPLAPLDTLTPIASALGPRAALHVVQGADHSFAVRKRDGRDSNAIMHELAHTMASWMNALTRAVDR